MSTVEARPDEEVRAAVARLNGLLEKVERLPDPLSRAAATEALQCVLELYGEGLLRIVETVARHDEGSIAAELAEDELVSHLLLLHGLHPLPPEARIRMALDAVRADLQARGHRAELASVENGVARVTLSGESGGCPSSAARLRQELEQMLLDAVPELSAAVCEAVPEGFVALSSVR